MPLALGDGAHSRPGPDTDPYPYSPDGRPSFVPETEMRARLPRESRVAASMRLDFWGEGPALRARALRDAGADLLIVAAIATRKPPWPTWSDSPSRSSQPCSSGLSSPCQWLLARLGGRTTRSRSLDTAALRPGHLQGQQVLASSDARTTVGNHVFALPHP